MELIVNEKLFNENTDDWCDARDVKYSNINKNEIYVSGNFTEKLSNEDLGSGCYTYNLENRNRILLLPDAVYGSENLILLDNETRIFNSLRVRIGVLNIANEILEWYGKPLEDIFSTKVIYSNENNYFLGFTANNISKFTYDSQTIVEEPNIIESVVSPNPTSGLVNLQFPCVNEPYSYSIIDVNGSKLEQKVISSSSNELQLDLYSFPIGVYYLIIECSSGVTTYKILREG